MPTRATQDAALDAWEARWQDSDHHGPGTLALAVAEYADVVDHTSMESGILVQNDEPYQLWGDLRPSEAQRLHDLFVAATARAFDRARDVILDELTSAAGRRGHRRLEGPGRRSGDA